MVHRHLNHQGLTLAAIDDLISRGRRKDWARLRLAVLDSAEVAAKVKQVCVVRVRDPYAQRYHFWMNYVEERNA